MSFCFEKVRQLQDRTLDWRMYLRDDSAPACSKVAVAMEAARASINNRRLPQEALEWLGVLEGDQRALQVISAAIPFFPEAYFVPGENPGSFFVYHEEVCLGTFLVGERIANLELFRRGLAFFLSLASYMPCGIFCSAIDLPVSVDRPLIKQLFNGSWVSIHPVDKTAQKISNLVLGIFSPTIAQQPSHLKEEREVCEFIFSLISSILYFSHLESSKDWCDPISPNVMEKLKALVAGWDIEAIMTFAQEQDIEFYDSVAEDHKEGQSPFCDGEENLLSLVSPPASEEEDLYDEERNPDLKLLLPIQIKRLKLTLDILKKFIGVNKSLSRQQIFEELNRHYTRKGLPVLMLMQNVGGSSSDPVEWDPCVNDVVQPQSPLPPMKEDVFQMANTGDSRSISCSVSPLTPPSEVPALQSQALPSEILKTNTTSDAKPPDVCLSPLTPNLEGTPENPQSFIDQMLELQTEFTQEDRFSPLNGPAYLGKIIRPEPIYPSRTPN